MKVIDWLTVPTLWLFNRLGVHYSYVAVAVYGLLTLIGCIGATFTIGVFTDDFMAALDITRTSVSLCWTLAMLGTAVAQPVLGRILDRWGAKLLLLATLPLFLAGCFLLGHAGSWPTLLLCFFLMRFGMAACSQAGSYTVNQWWVRRRGTAMAVANAISSVGLALPALLLAIRALVGWQETLFIEALAALVGLSVLWFALLDRPESYGMLPDATPANDDTVAAEFKPIAREQILDDDEEESQHDARIPDTAFIDDDDDDSKLDDITSKLNDITSKLNDVEATTPAKLKAVVIIDEEDEQRENDYDDDEKLTVIVDAGFAGEIHWRWRDALLTPFFWLTVLGMFFSSLLWSGFNFHYVELLNERGIDQQAEYASLFPVVAGSSIVVTLLAGPLLDRLTVKSHMVAIGMLFAALCVGCLLALRLLPSVVLVNVYALSYGAMDGTLLVGFLTVFAAVFGRVEIGTIDAVAGFFNTAAVGIGPLLYGASREWFGSFDPVLYVTLGAIIVFATGLFIVGTPAPPPEHRRLHIQPTLSSAVINSN